MEIVKYEGEESWQAARAGLVTSSRVAALFGLHPYCSPFGLWSDLHHGVPPESHDSERRDTAMALGLALEDAIATFAQNIVGQTAVRYRAFHVDRELRAGASYDYILGDGSVLEIKNVGAKSLGAWESKTAMPAHVDLQVQMQLMMMPGAPGAYVFALLGGTDYALLERKPNPELQETLRTAIASFWANSRTYPMPEADDRAAVRLKLRLSEPNMKQATEPQAKMIKSLWAAQKKAAELPDLRAQIRHEMLKNDCTGFLVGRRTVTSEGL